MERIASTGFTVRWARASKLWSPVSVTGPRPEGVKKTSRLLGKLIVPPVIDQAYVAFGPASATLALPDAAG